MGALSSHKFIAVGVFLLGLVILGLLVAPRFDLALLTGQEPVSDAAAQMTAASADATVSQFSSVRDASQSVVGTKQNTAPPQNTGESPPLKTAETAGLSELEQRLFTEGLERETARAVEIEERKWAAANSPLGQSIHGSVPAFRSVPTYGSVPGTNNDQKEHGGDQNRPAQAYDDQSAPFPDLEPDNALADLESRTAPESVTALQGLPQTRNSQNHTALAAGTVIAAALMGDIRSELPGLVRAMVTHDVFDSQTLRFVVIPRGSQLIGSYSDQTRVGQKRLFVYWTQVRFPDGRVFDLDRSATLDTAGASGLTGRRQSGFLTAIVQSALLGLAQNAGQGSARGTAQSSDLAEAARIATGQATGTVAERYLENHLKRGTRFTIKAGTVLNLILERAFVFPAVARDHGARDRNGLGQPTLARTPGNTDRTGPTALVLVAGQGRQTDRAAPYDRSDYSSWADIDGDCQNTRHEVRDIAALWATLCA